ncbi:NAD(P)-dependent oxidoreductase [Bradyrhizobium sp.]|jgi:dTDP-6-deoxy-L-talose 4-dehydrogenase (NAD+)|uniref:NAD-dependent epimerase/dehydratase family protein n=1 Tax=Bradyrhizobium sp. TaxID=376 RepID=UPI002E068DFB|nr:NAD(P)-dependent oxidoreductase [Bradyrhizobium sp.]
MKVAVTGARGFIGRHVLGELARRDVEVIATERPDVVRERPAEANVRWIALDMARPPENPFVALANPDVLLHLAWNGLPNYRSLHHFESELPRQYGFLSNVIRGGLPALVTAGTCFEYGRQSGALAANLETRPTNPYGFAKDVLRKQLQYLKAVHPYKLTWARLFYMYGDDQPATSLFAALKAAVAAGHSEFPMSGGEQLRDYLPVSEVARRLVDLAINPGDPGPINLCSGQPVSVRRLVEGWIGQNGWKIQAKYGELPYPDYEPMAFWGDSADARR